MAKDGMIVIHKRKGLKNLIKKIVWLQNYQVGCGFLSGGPIIHRGTNLARLAKMLEEGYTFIQSKTFYVPEKRKKFSGGYTVTSKAVVIPKGTSHTVPARPFIHLNKYPAIWNLVRSQVRKLIGWYLSGKTFKHKDCRTFYDLLGKFVIGKQKGIIGSSKLADNSALTVMLKGKNTPLFEKGKMRNAIIEKVSNNKNGQSKVKKGEIDNKYAIQIDKIIADINKYSGKGKK